jgi:hypothetical protein
MDQLIGIIVLFVILAVVYWRSQGGHGTRPVQAGLSARAWNVVSDFDNNTQAAELLSRVHARVVEFMRFLRKKYHIGETDDIVAAEGAVHSQVKSSPHDIYNIVSHLLENYNPDGFYENDPRRSADTSYTVDKGSAMYICLRDRADVMRLVGDDDLLFVILHECAHVANYNDFGHGNRYWEVFKFVLHEAELAGVYRPVDYSKYPIIYCGLRVSYNPLYDTTLRNLWAG